MNRRQFVLVGSIGAAGWSLAALPASSRTPRLGVLALTATAEPFWTFLRESLRELGYVDGKNIHVELRSVASPKLLAEAAAELVRLRPDVIAVIQGTAAEAMQRATKDIPIVLAPAGDAVAMRLVESLARPGMNVTGVSANVSETAGKTVQLIREMMPALRRIAALIDTTSPLAEPFLQHVVAAGKAISLEVEPIPVKGPTDVATAGIVLAKMRPEAAIIQPALGAPAVDVVLRQRIAPVSQNSGLATAGCLLTYSADIPAMCRKAAGYIDRILKGAKPADLPVEQPTKFELVINMKTARTLSISVPQAVLVRADRVIE